MLISFVMIFGFIIEVSATAFEYITMGDFESLSLFMKTVEILISDVISDGFVGLSSLLEQISAYF